MALEAVKKDPLYGMDSWRPIPYLETDIVLRNEPEQLDVYVEKVLGSAQLSWKLQGRAIGTKLGQNESNSDHSAFCHPTILEICPLLELLQQTYYYMTSQTPYQPSYRLHRMPAHNKNIIV